MVFSYSYRSIMLFHCAQSNIQGKRTRDLRKTNTLSSRIRRECSHNAEVTHFEFPHVYATLQDLNYFDRCRCFQLGLSPVQPPNGSLTMTLVPPYRSYQEPHSGIYLHTLAMPLSVLQTHSLHQNLLISVLTLTPCHHLSKHLAQHAGMLLFLQGPYVD